MPANDDALLLEPLRVRDWRLRNRIVMPPMVTVRNIVEADGIEWYGRHAAGGPGLVIIEATGVPRFADDITAESLRPIVEAIHAAGAGAAIQLFPVRFVESADVGSLSEADLAGIIEGYRKAARICLEAGMDGVEPHGAHGYLLNRFFSPADNPRTDRYGGTLENRMRLGLETVRAIVAEIGKEMMMLYRHTPEKADSYATAESLVFARELVASGVDILDLSPSSRDAPGDLAQPFMGLGAHVITVGAMDDPGRAAEALREGRADLVAVGRALIADPDWPAKKAANREADVVGCIRCNKACFGNLRKHIPIACTQW